MSEGSTRRRVDLVGYNGLRLAADVAGDPSGPPVVLLHGGGQTRHAWGTTLDVLAERGWFAHTVDLRGHGDSAWDEEGDYTMDAFANDVRAIADGFREPPVLVGASLGGLSSLTAVGEARPGESVARALVLVDVAPRLEEQGRNRIGSFMMANIEEGFASLEEVADAIAAYNPHRPRSTDLTGLQKNLRQRADGRWFWHWDPRFITGRFGSTEETRSTLTDGDRFEEAARRITIPTLLVRGRTSDLLSEEGAAHFLTLTPHAQLVNVAGAGHMVAGDRNDLFNDAVARFLDETRDV